MTATETKELSDDDKVRIRNLVGHLVVIVSPIHHRRWELPPFGQMDVKVGDVRECSYDEGCRNIFRDYVQICNPKLASEFGVQEDTIEYNWTNRDVVDALTTKPIEVLEDAMDFAPDGIKEAIIDKAVELEIPDMDRRKAIEDASGVNITNKIANARAAQTSTNTSPKRSQRRVSSTPKRTRRATPEKE